MTQKEYATYLSKLVRERPGRKRTILLGVLDEAYYSISCSYYLSVYLQYPRLKRKPETDFLQPYFELWQRGYDFIIEEEKLILA